MDILKGKPVSVFFYNAIPAVLGMLAISSASVVDGYFLGNYVGAEALAAVNLVTPVISLILGVGLMIAIGGSVVCGKFTGENELEQAGLVFSRTLIAIGLFCSVMSAAGLIFIDEVIPLLGTNAELVKPVREYLEIYLWFIIFLCGGICLSHFIRIDGKPVIASASIITGSACNVILDWLFVAHMDMGIKGAALATGLAYLIIFLMLLYPMLFRSRIIKFRLKGLKWTGFFKACFNGMSEFINEISIGIVIMVVNWLIIARMGTQGVAAFTVINYFLYLEMIVIYGISESLQPLISTNYGAGEGDRIKKFMKIAALSIGFISLLSIILLLHRPEYFVSLFLKDGDVRTTGIALEFISILWPIFIFNGFNVLFSSYLTSVHRAVPSAMIAVTRSLVLPVSLLFILPHFMGDTGLYASFPVAEMLSFVMAIAFFIKFTPGRVCTVTE